MNLHRIASLAGLCIGLSGGLAFGCAAGRADSPSGTATGGAAGGEDGGPTAPTAGSSGEPHPIGGAGGAGQPVATTDSGVDVVVAADSGPYPEYHPSCEEQQCTADEQCVDGPQGTYCVHPCPGQPCPRPEMSAYCERNGGVICL